MRAAALLALLAVHCGDSPGGPGPDETGPEGAGAAEGEGEGEGGEAPGFSDPGPPPDYEPAPPETPQPPDFQEVPCPPGWEHDPDTRNRGACVPHMPTDCHEHVPLPGFELCERLGTRCPVNDEFLSEDEIRAMAPGFDGRIYYLRPRAGGGGGVGTREDPAAGLPRGAVSPGDIVHMGVIDISGPTFVIAGIALVGACTVATTLNSPADGPAVLIVGPDPGLVTNLRIRGGNIGIGLDNPGVGEVRDVLIDGVAQRAITVNGGRRLIADGVGIRRVSRPEDDASIGISVSPGGGAALRRVFIERVRGVGINLREVSDSVLEDVLVRDVLGGLRATGIRVMGDGAVRMARVVVQDAGNVGVIAGDDSQVEAEDLVVVGGQLGVAVADGAATLRRFRIQHQSTAGISVGTEGFQGRLVAEDGLIRKINLDSLNFHAFGVLMVGDEVEAELRRVRITDSVGTALRLSRGALDAADIEAFDMRTAGIEEDGATLHYFGGQALKAINAKEVRLSRVLSRKARHRAIWLASDTPTPTELVAEDIDITDTRMPVERPVKASFIALGSVRADVRRLRVADSQGFGAMIGARVSSGFDFTGSDLEFARLRRVRHEPGGGGVLFAGRGRGDLSRVRVDDTVEDGFATFLDHKDERQELTVRDLVVQGVRSDPVNGILGGGVFVSKGADVTLQGALVRSTRDAAIFLEGWQDRPPTRLTAERLVIDGVAQEECAESPELWPSQQCVVDGRSTGGGYGIFVQDDAVAHLRDFRIARAYAPGLNGQRFAFIDADEGSITTNGIGLNLEDPESPDVTLGDRLFVHGNDLDFARQELPPPGRPDLAQFVDELE